MSSKLTKLENLEEQFNIIQDQKEERKEIPEQSERRRRKPNQTTKFFYERMCLNKLQYIKTFKQKHFLGH